MLDVKPLEHFKQESDMICYVLKRAPGLLLWADGVRILFQFFPPSTTENSRHYI